LAEVGRISPDGEGSGPGTHVRDVSSAPPSARRRDPPEEERYFGGLQRGSTAIQYAQQQEPGQGLRARARRQGWAEGGACTDSGHIDWLLAAHEFAKGQPLLRALRVGVATEMMVPPLPPRQPSEVPSLPPGGCIFPSDHYPVFADVQLVPHR